MVLMNITLAKHMRMTAMVKNRYIVVATVKKKNFKVKVNFFSALFDLSYKKSSTKTSRFFDSGYGGRYMVLDRE